MTPTSHSPRAFERATVQDAMHAGIITCTPDTPLAEVAGLMAEQRVHAVAVLGIGLHGREQLVWGIVSDLDLIRAVQDDGPSGPSAGEIAATEPVTIGAGDSLATAAQLMREHDVHHLVVVDGPEPEPVGILSSLDVAGVLARGA